MKDLDISIPCHFVWVLRQSCCTIQSFCPHWGVPVYGVLVKFLVLSWMASGVHILCIFVSTLAALISFCSWTCKKVVYFVFRFVVSMWIIFNVMFLDLSCCFVHLFVFFHVVHFLSGSLCSAAVANQSLAFLVMLLHFLGLHRNFIDAQCLCYYCDYAYPFVVWMSWYGSNYYFFVNEFI